MIENVSVDFYLKLINESESILPYVSQILFQALNAQLLNIRSWRRKFYLWNAICP